MNKTNPLQDIEINLNLYNLYTILLQYFEKLNKLKHPKLNLVTEIMDELIILRQKEIDETLLKSEFNAIHSKAFTNLNEIYDYDKTVEELNGNLIIEKEGFNSNDCYDSETGEETEEFKKYKLKEQKELEDIAVSD